jgi:hypothetical protein
MANQPVLVSQGAGAPQAAHCELSFQPSDQSWKGQCGPIFRNTEVTPLTACKVTSLPGGAGRSGATPVLMLVGGVSTQYGTWDLEFEFYGRDGAVRTPAAWRPVKVSSGLAETTLKFNVVEESEVEPNDLDRRIIERAAGILASEAMWDRADDRVCAPEDKTWSIYCAIHRASVDVTGGFHHRRPCLQIARTILYERVAEARKNGRKYPHILANYNNDPATRFADVRSLFSEIVARTQR